MKVCITEFQSSKSWHNVHLLLLTPNPTLLLPVADSYMLVGLTQSDDTSVNQNSAPNKPL